MFSTIDKIFHNHHFLHQTVTTTGEEGEDEVWDHEKPCSHNMQSAHLPRWSEDNCSVFFSK